MRTFIAVNFPEDLKKEVLRVYQDLKHRIKGSVRWVTPENLHFTLKFLGEISEDEIFPVTDAVSRAIQSREPFSLSLDGPGVFPNITRPRVLWLGVQQGQAELKALHQSIDSELEGLGFPRERRSYYPHLTLARFKGQIAGLRQALDNFSLQREIRMEVAEVDLMESRLYRRGPEYLCLKKFSLQR